MLKSILRKRLGRFASETDGYVTLEALIVMPALLWLFGVGWVYFDAFRQQSVNQKANYVIGDMISRETDPLDDSYIDNATRLLHHLTKADIEDAGLRVTVVRFDAGQNRWRLDWSEARGSNAPLQDNAFRTTGGNVHYANRLPVGLHGDRLIVVETWDAYDPVFRVGLDAFEVYSFSFTRPRFTPQVLFTDSGSGQNDGFGSGDQDAAGNSLCDNTAETAGDGAMDPSCTNEDGALNVEPSSGTGSGGS